MSCKILPPSLKSLRQKMVGFFFNGLDYLFIQILFNGLDGLDYSNLGCFLRRVCIPNLGRRELLYHLVREFEFWWLVLCSTYWFQGRQDSKWSYIRNTTCASCTEGENMLHHVCIVSGNLRQRKSCWTRFWRSPQKHHASSELSRFFDITLSVKCLNPRLQRIYGIQEHFYSYYMKCKYRHSLLSVIFVTKKRGRFCQS